MKTKQSIIIAVGCAGLALSGTSKAEGVVSTLGSAAGTVGSAVGTVGSGVLDAGRGLASLPGRALRSGSDELPMLSAGTQELGIGGNINFADDTAYNLDFSYGYFFRNCWEVGFTANAFGEDSDISFGVGLFTEYNFSTGSKWVPYVGFAAKWQKVDSDFFDESSIAFTGELGVKYFIRSHMAVYGAINFEWSPDDVFGVGENIKDSAENINIGMRFYF